MKVFTNLLLLTLLLVALHAESVPVASATYYTVQNQSYLYIYGNGAQGSPSLGDRSVSTVSSGSQNSNYVAPAAGPTPVAITCPYNQVYDNILCQCVCIIGYHF